MGGCEEILIKNRDLLIREGVLSGTGQGFSMKENGRIYYLSDSGDPVCSDPKGVYGVSGAAPPWLAVHLSVYRKYKGFTVIIQSLLPYTMTAAKAGEDVPPLLDDFAQLVGVNARVVTVRPEGPNFPESVVKGLKRRNAVLIPGWGGLCCAGTFDDALAVAQVLEKGCQALVDTSFLGGGHRINRIESWLMRLVYRYKYSKTKG